MRVIEELGKLKLTDEQKLDTFKLDIFNGNLVFFCLTAQVEERLEFLEGGECLHVQEIICDTVIDIDCLGTFNYDDFASDVVNGQDSIVEAADRKASYIKGLNKRSFRDKIYRNDFVNVETNMFDILSSNEKARVRLRRCTENEVATNFIRYNRKVLDFFSSNDKTFFHELDLSVNLPAEMYDTIYSLVCGEDSFEQLYIVVKIGSNNNIEFDSDNDEAQISIINNNLFCERYRKSFRLVFPNWLNFDTLQDSGFPGPVPCVVEKINLIHNRTNIKSKWHKALHGTWDNPKRSNTDIDTVVDVLQDVKISTLEIQKTSQEMQKTFLS